MSDSVPQVLNAIEAAGPLPDARGRVLPAELAWLRNQQSKNLFPDALAPELAYAALLLAAGGWEEAHEVAQGIETHEGAYLHGMIHRQEPDPFNADYWFRRAGILYFAGKGSSGEWRAFFDHCARSTSR